MPTLPTKEDIDNYRAQANQTFGEAVQQARTPFMVAVGASDMAANAMVDTMYKVRDQINDGAESARSGVTDLPNELNELRSKLEPRELRKMVDEWTGSAAKFYDYLAHRGEDALGRWSSQPRVQQAWSQFEGAQERVEGAVGDARDFADDMLSRVSTATRSYGEKAARTAQSTAEDTADSVRKAADQTAEAATETGESVATGVEDAGSQTATSTRSTARKTANRTAATAPATAPATAKSTNGTKTAAAKQPKSAARKSSTSSNNNNSSTAATTAATEQSQGRPPQCGCP